MSLELLILLREKERRQKKKEGGRIDQDHYNSYSRCFQSTTKITFFRLSSPEVVPVNDILSCPRHSPLHNHYYPMIAQTQISGNRWGWRGEWKSAWITRRDAAEYYSNRSLGTRAPPLSLPLYRGSKSAFPKFIRGFFSEIWPGSYDNTPSWKKFSNNRSPRSRLI